MMDMKETPGGVPWLTQPPRFHSSRESKCKLNPAQCAYIHGYWRNWYQGDHVYALGTVYFCCAMIGLFVLSNILVRYSPDWLKRTPVWRGIASMSRYLSYRGYSIPKLRYWSPSLGVLLLGMAGTGFFLGMTLGPQPYYWPTDAHYGNSPPLANRTGWMALGLLPFVLVLSTKANMISMLTGISHEKLQVFHHWASYAMFVLALVHTFPFIIIHQRWHDLVYQWKTSVVYWTGVVAIIAQAYLTFMSLPFIRNRFYEYFKGTHMLAALVFIIFLFFHCNASLTSWDYFIATGALYLSCLAFSMSRTYLMNGLHKATIELLPSGLLRVSVPTAMNWHPGQHVFIRFLTSDLHLLTAHPFTISSVRRNPDETGTAPELVFYIKPRGGVTARLAAIANKIPGCSKTVLIEGPYGGVSAHHMASFDTILVIAGGSGGGFSLAMVDEVLRLSALESKGIEPVHDVRRNLQVVFSTRDTAMAEWYAAEIEDRLSHSTTFTSDLDNGFETAVSVHVTSRVNSNTSSPAIGFEKEPGKMLPTEVTTTGSFSLNVHRNARPDIAGLIARTVATSGSRGNHVGRKQRVGVLVCGPASMLHDTRNAAALAQKRVMDGEVEELYLHSEPFAW
ncbi:hypothetical protein N7478_008636 [Penicillium angulare]|uniref:uncharacterized protein n=1 Tax=Penicillium angulare TaxID=116970 RepID=UPI00253FD58E|nr:uncharacterized protein N7478_008636 [Penicillium angulare]KAJ5273511.1 hypothetical protein N7478_008636 [Penicillium angulare]